MATRQRLAEVLAALPAPDGSQHDIEELAWHAGVIYRASGLGALNEIPRMRPASEDATRKQLLEFARLARELGLHIDQKMNAPALQLLEKTRGEAMHTGKLFAHLAEAIENGRRAWTEIDAAGLPKKSRGGAPSKLRAKRVTRAAVVAFEALTGKKATLITSPSGGAAYGPALEFLEGVFAALGLSASPEAQLRELRRKP